MVTADPVITAETYARWRASTLGGITERVETTLVFALAGQLAGKRVLDVGTGDGTYAFEAASRGAVVTGLDSEQPMLDAAQTRVAQRGLSVTLRQGRAQELPFKEGSFDVVLAVTVLCFVPEAATAVREMARVLVPGGRTGAGGARPVQRLGCRAPYAWLAGRADMAARTLLVTPRTRRRRRPGRAADRYGSRLCVLSAEPTRGTCRGPTRTAPEPDARPRRGVPCDRRRQA